MEAEEGIGGRPGALRGDESVVIIDALEVGVAGGVSGLELQGEAVVEQAVFELRGAAELG